MSKAGIMSLLEGMFKNGRLNGIGRRYIVSHDLNSFQYDYGIWNKAKLHGLGLRQTQDSIQKGFFFNDVYKYSDDSYNLN